MYRDRRAGGFFVAVLAVCLLVTWPAYAGPLSQSPNKTIIYFARHAEDHINLLDDPADPDIMVKDCMDVGGESCCMETLNELGLKRAEELGEWFEANQIARKLTHVVASHKIRTRQTVQRIALLAGLGGDQDGDGAPDGQDPDDLRDQEPGDGVINIPFWPAECDEGWTGSGSAAGPQIEYIAALPLGSRAVVCSHSPTLYPIMEAFGIDTSDPVDFPRRPNGKVDGFDNLWIVELDAAFDAEGNPTCQGRLVEHLVLDLMIP